MFDFLFDSGDIDGLDEDGAIFLEDGTVPNFAEEYCYPDEIMGEQYVYYDNVLGFGTVCMDGEIHFADGTIVYL